MREKFTPQIIPNMFYIKFSNKLISISLPCRGFNNACAVCNAFEICFPYSAQFTFYFYIIICRYHKFVLIRTPNSRKISQSHFALRMRLNRQNTLEVQQFRLQYITVFAKIFLLDIIFS